MTTKHEVKDTSILNPSILLKNLGLRHPQIMFLA